MDAFSAANAAARAEVLQLWSVIGRTATKAWVVVVATKKSRVDDNSSRTTRP